jgi:hypothetical protein
LVPLVEQASTSSTHDVVETSAADVGGVSVVGGWSRRRPSLVPRSGLLDHRNRPLVEQRAPASVVETPEPVAVA